MLDRALAKVFAELATLLLIACVFTGPLFIGHAIFFRGPLALRELAPEIEKLPEGRQVRGVSSGDIEAERRWLLVIFGVALLSIPFVHRGAGRVFQVHEVGDVPTVPDALAHLSSKHRPRLDIRVLASATVLAALSGWLVWQLTHLLAGFGPERVTWLVIGVGRAVAVGLFVALLSGTVAACSPSAAKAPPPAPERVDLY